MQVDIQLRGELTRVAVTLEYYGSEETKRIAWELFSTRPLRGVYSASEPFQVVLGVPDRSAETLAGIFARAREVQEIWVALLNEVERHATLHRLSDELHAAAAPTAGLKLEAN